VKKVIASLIVTAISTIALVFVVAYFVYQGIYLEINKASNSAPSWVAFIPAALFGIVLAPYIVTLVNHFKSLKLIRANHHLVNKKTASPILVVYFLVCASIVIVIVYLIFDGILTKKIMNFSELGYSLSILGLVLLLFIVPIVMMIILIHEKKKV
jgi:hypothetical protein